MLKVHDIVIRIVCKCGNNTHDEADCASTDISQPKFCCWFQLPRRFLQFLEKHKKENKPKRSKTISSKTKIVRLASKPEEEIQEKENTDKRDRVSDTE